MEFSVVNARESVTSIKECGSTWNILRNQRQPLTNWNTYSRDALGEQLNWLPEWFMQTTCAHNLTNLNGLARMCIWKMSELRHPLLEIMKVGQDGPFERGRDSLSFSCTVLQYVTWPVLALLRRHSNIRLVVSGVLACAYVQMDWAILNWLEFEFLAS